MRGRAFFAQAWCSPLPSLAALSLVALCAYAALPPALALSVICGTIEWRHLIDPLLLAAVIPSPWLLGAGWALMAAVMMPPLVSKQVSYLRAACPTRARAPGITAFLGAYLILWILAGLLLVPLATAISATLASPLDTVLVLALGLVWSASPYAQDQRNRCHRMTRIGPRLTHVLRNSGYLGMRTGHACIAICWPWMILPMTVDGAHIAAMLLASVYIFADRISPAATVRWRMPPALDTLGITALFAGRAQYRKTAG